MPSSCRSREAGWRPGQHNSRPSGSGSTARSLLALLCACLAASGQSLLQIRVLEGEKSIHRAAGKSSSGIEVQVTDETGKPVEGAAVSFRMPEEGPSLTFVRGMRTEIAVTGPDGRAAVRGMTANRVTGPMQVRVTAVKSPLRAGIIVHQFISDAPVRVERPRRSGRSKWIALAAIAASGAAVAVLTTSRASSPAAVAAPPVPPPQVGAPSITIGRP